ncbi:MAG: ATP-dependent Clp protease adaptor ClpS [Planctomycetes bacterium]|nr:ATP-dependent Clp protease adaptor ClpS [Planctomycetota bacterium]
MADKRADNSGQSSEKSMTAVKPAPARRKPKPKMLPPFKVLLHNDDKNMMEDVVASILMLTPLKEQEAILRMLEAHKTGCALLLVTHKERAELYVEQFASCKITVTMEADE